MRVFLGIALILLCAVVLWYMAKAFGANFQGQKAEAERFPRQRRKFYWLAALALPVCIGVGAVLGAVVEPTNTFFTSEVEGDAIGLGAGLVAVVGLMLLAGHPERPDGPWFTRSKSDS